MHLRYPRLAAVCRKIQIDFAHAMTGFDIRGGRSIPAIEGVVVCEEFEVAVMDAYREEERQVLIVALFRLNSAVCD